MINYVGLLIQTDKLIFFYDVLKPEKFECLVDYDYEVKLDVLRGMSDRIYYALRDEGAASDSLHVLKFRVRDAFFSLDTVTH